jgi:hypothetical protein
VCLSRITAAFLEFVRCSSRTLNAKAETNTYLCAVLEMEFRSAGILLKRETRI